MVRASSPTLSALEPRRSTPLKVRVRVETGFCDQTVLPLVQAHYPLERALDAFDHAQRPGTLKVLLDIA